MLIYDDIEYGRSLGQTSKFPKDSIAFKWKDEIRETTLEEIEWSASRTGPVSYTHLDVYKRQVCRRYEKPG